MNLGKIVGLPISIFRALHIVIGDYRFRTQLIEQHQKLRLGKWVEIRSPERLKLGVDVTIETGVLLHWRAKWSGAWR